MPQITWRAEAPLVDRIRSAASEEHRSVNDFITRVLDAATDPDLAGSEAERIRERLARAGVLAGTRPARGRPDPELLARARAVAGRGTPLADLVSDDRG